MSNENSTPVIRGVIKVSNMSAELFNDALFYREMVESSNNFYIKWRYRRSAIISFCASAEAWMNNIIKDNLEKKVIAEKSYEQELLNFVKNYNSKMPKGFNNVRNKLYNFIPKAINRKEINWKTNYEESFEEYIKLSNIRNSVIHYAVSNSVKVHSDEFIDFVKKAPNIIENIFQRYCLLGSTLGVPEWYRQRKSRILE